MQALLVLVSCATKYPGLNMILQDMLVPLLPFARDAAGNFRPPLHWVSHALRVALFGELGAPRRGYVCVWLSCRVDPLHACWLSRE